MPLSITPGLVLACWKACTRSLLAVCSITGVVGMFFIPDEIERLSVLPVRGVYQCELLPDKTHFAVIESSFHTVMERGAERRLAVYERRGGAAYRTLLEFPPDPVCLAPHPKGSPLFVAGASGEIRAVSSLSKSCKAAALLGCHSQGHAEKLACSSDGRTLVSSDYDALYVWDLTNWKLRWCLVGEVACWGLHPDSRRLIACRKVGAEYAVVSLDLQTGESTTIWHCPGGAWHSLQMGSLGQTMIGIDADGWLFAFRQGDNLDNWQPVPLPGVQPQPQKLYALSPTETLIAAALAGESCIQIWNLQTGQSERRLSLRNHSTIPVGMRFLNDQELLAWGSFDLLWVWEFTRTAQADALEIRSAESEHL